MKTPSTATTDWWHGQDWEPARTPTEVPYGGWRGAEVRLKKGEHLSIYWSLHESVFFVWHWWMEMGRKSLSHSIASKLSQRGIFTLSPSSKFKCQTMAWLKASKSCVLPVGRGTCFHKAVQNTLDWSLPLKKCELLSKATAFPVQWHIGRQRILPIMTNAAHERLRRDSWKSAWKEHTEAHEFLKWNVPMELLSTGILNEKPDFSGTSCCKRHSNSGNETGKWSGLIYHHASVKQKCSLWGLRNSPNALCAFCHGLWGQICSQSKCSQHGFTRVSQASG